MIREIHMFDHEFTLQPKWYGYVLMFRESEPAAGPGDWQWGKWRKATWKDMTRFDKEKLK